MKLRSSPSSFLLPLTLLALLAEACGSSAASSSADAGTPKDAAPAGDTGAHAPHDAGTSHADTGSHDAAREATASETSTPPTDAAAEAAIIGGSRPVPIYVPASYKEGQPAALVMMLHGYSATGPLEELYLDLKPQAEAHGFIYAYPNGTIDSSGNRFWNATDACCNFNASTVDDSGYLSGVITQIESVYTIDPKQVFILGHSNGAFMAYRMACDHADQIAAIVSLAGAMWETVSSCQPSAPVSMVEIHGTADTTIAYDGGNVGLGPFPSAPTSVSDWVTFDGCDTTPDTTAPPLDLDSTLLGDETTVTKYGTGCMPGGHAELWSIQGGTHIPTLSATFAPDVIGYLLAHPKP